MCGAVMDNVWCIHKKMFKSKGGDEKDLEREYALMIDWRLDKLKAVRSLDYKKVKKKINKHPVKRKGSVDGLRNMAVKEGERKMERNADVCAELKAEDLIQT